MRTPGAFAGPPRGRGVHLSRCVVVRLSQIIVFFFFFFFLGFVARVFLLLTFRRCPCRCVSRVTRAQNSGPFWTQIMILGVLVVVKYIELKW